MFYLNKADMVWTLTYEVGPWRRVLLVGTGLVGIGLAVAKDLQTGLDGSTLAVVVGVLVAVGLLAYWVVSDAPSTVTFDLGRSRLEVYCARPWFGPPRSVAFGDVAALSAVKRSGETVDSWEAWLELRDGSRIRLGREAEGTGEHIRRYLDEIRRATGIGG